MQSVILGTAQWGLDYGITNDAGRLSDEAVLAVSESAVAHGVTVLDTAPAYGDAEQRIGALTPFLDVQTKVSAAADPAGVRDSVARSRELLRRDVLSAVLVHDWPTVAPADRARVAAELEQLRADGWTRAVGVSGYEESDVVSALGAFGRLDVVQVPVSVLDQRLVGSDAIAQVRARGGRVQGRSVLLQGVAVAAADHARFGTHPDVVRLRDTGRPLAVCLGFVRSQDWIDDLLLAATTVDELEQLLGSDLPDDVDWAPLASQDPVLVDPRRWGDRPQGG